MSSRPPLFGNGWVDIVAKGPCAPRRKWDPMPPVINEHQYDPYLTPSPEIPNLSYSLTFFNGWVARVCSGSCAPQKTWGPMPPWGMVGNADGVVHVVGDGGPAAHAADHNHHLRGWDGDRQVGRSRDTIHMRECGEYWVDCVRASDKAPHPNPSHTTTPIGGWMGGG